MLWEDFLGSENNVNKNTEYLEEAKINITQIGWSQIMEVFLNSCF